MTQEKFIIYGNPRTGRTSIVPSHPDDVVVDGVSEVHVKQFKEARDKFQAKARVAKKKRRLAKKRKDRPWPRGK